MPARSTRGSGRIADPRALLRDQGPGARRGAPRSRRRGSAAVRADIYTEDTHAWALYRAGKLAEARAASDRALALGTRDARLLYHAGAIRIALGDLARGERLVRDALALNPGFDMTGPPRPSSSSHVASAPAARRADAREARCARVTTASVEGEHARRALW